MDILGKKVRLAAIYADYAQQVQQYKTGAVCKIGCAFCCTHFGNVDVITLEGLVIHEWINGLEKPAQRRIRKKIVKNMKKKEKGTIARCPFLATDSTCQIYPLRPFSCRQLYSMKECNEKGPTVHRQAVALAKKTVKRLQQMDNTGYSGHISFILHMLDRSDFRKLYESGGFNPAEIASFGKAHGIIINQVVSAS